MSLSNGSPPLDLMDSRCLPVLSIARKKNAIGLHNLLSSAVYIYMGGAIRGSEHYLTLR